MKIRQKINITLCVALFSLFATGCVAMTINGLNGTQVAVCVVDDANVPIGEVHTEIFEFHEYNAPFGFTDSNGMYSRHIKNIYGSVVGVFKKEGYYKTIGSFWKWAGRNEILPASTNFTIVMKRIENPVPIIYRRIGKDIPVNQEEVFFDLAVGDWVMPHGKGKSPDISFIGTIRFETRRDLDIEVSATFTDPLSGLRQFSAPSENTEILRSTLIPPQIAPTNGYEKTLKMWYSYNSQELRKTNFNSENNYIFRTRVVTNSVGEIVAANYGWISGDIKVHTTSGAKPWIGFKYYYNPDPHSRSLEPKDLADQQAKELAETMRNLNGDKRH
jgi:hypothetical protein